MEQVKLGNSGLNISKVVFGCMSFGDSSSWGKWVVEDENKVFDMLNKAYEKGIRTFDTANVYSNGKSELILGKWIKKFDIDRSKIVIMSKCFFPQDKLLEGKPRWGNQLADFELINKKGLSRVSIFQSVQDSVDRLGTYMDVLQIHRFDPDTPKKEIMKALNDIVEKGLTRYIGASAMRAVEFAELQYIADKYDYHKFISMQSYYSLLFREDERELNHFCNVSDFGKVGLIPFSPLSMGLLARPLSSEKTEREKSTKMLMDWYGLSELTDDDKTIIDRTEELAKKFDVPMAAVAIAWLWKKGAYPIVGVSSTKRIDDYMEALKVKLSDEDVKYLEEKYSSKKIFLY